MKKNAKKKLHRYIRFFSWILFIIYLVVMVYFLFFCEQFGRTQGIIYRYNIHPFEEIHRYIAHADGIGIVNVVINLLGNVVCFMPLGFVLPILSRRRWGWFAITMISMLASVTVEGIQLLSRLGSCDIDDIILNTLGGFLGYLTFLICNKIYRGVLKRGRERR